MRISDWSSDVCSSDLETGEQALYVNTAFTSHIEGLSTKESEGLLAHLYAQAAVPEIQCRFRWRAGSIVFWDNRAAQHYAASDYFPAVRRMERVTIAGDRPFYRDERSEEHTSELQSLMRISYAVFCLKKKK